MGWQDELRDQVARRTDGDLYDSSPYRWTGHICRTTPAVGDLLADKWGRTNETEVAGVAPGMMLLLGLRLDGPDGPHLNIGVRREVPWNRGELVVECDPATGMEVARFAEARDASGNPAYPPFDFASIVESWHDPPPLF